MNKATKVFFDQDYSFRWVLSRGTIWLGIWIFFTSLLNPYITVIITKIILLVIWLIVFIAWILLVKTKKKGILDERLLLAQWKAYAYSWTTWAAFIFILWLLIEGKYVNMSTWIFSILALSIMSFSYFIFYSILKNKA